MSASDVLIAALVLAAAGWLLHRSLWKSKGRCHGCAGAACGSTERDGSEALVTLAVRRVPRLGDPRPTSPPRGPDPG